MTANDILMVPQWRRHTCWWKQDFSRDVRKIEETVRKKSHTCIHKRNKEYVKWEEEEMKEKKSQIALRTTQFSVQRLPAPMREHPHLFMISHTVTSVSLRVLDLYWSVESVLFSLPPSFPCSFTLSRSLSLFLFFFFQVSFTLHNNNTNTLMRLRATTETHRSL